MKDYLTVPEAAKQLGLTKAAIYYWCRHKQIAHRRVGHKVLIHKSAVDAMIRDVPAEVVK